MYHLETIRKRIIKIFEQNGAYIIDKLTKFHTKFWKLFRYVHKQLTYFVLLLVLISEEIHLAESVAITSLFI